MILFILAQLQEKRKEILLEVKTWKRKKHEKDGLSIDFEMKAALPW